MENETMSAIAMIVALVAIVGVFGIGTYMYTYQPEKVDVSDMYENSVAINALGNEVEDLQDEIDGMSFPDISKSDLDDLEDYANWFDNIEKNADNIDDLEDRIDALENTSEPNNIDDIYYFSLLIYEVNDGYVDAFLDLEKGTHTIFIYNVLPGSYYLNVGALFLDSWSVTIEDYYDEEWLYVKTFDGASDTQTDIFDIRGTRFRLTYEVNP